MIIDTKKLQKAVMENKKKHGFNTTDIEFELLRLHGEANELFEAWRKNNKKNINEELADVGIFLLGIAEMLGSDLGEDIVNKMKINEKRIYKNGVKLGPADTNK
ncbi:MazG-like family protein [uncultured Lactobacillus sp.]|uniref:MazG-like family protein n=1 Tax=uncultured Lactobacillus sp. TaxID=153152 RepID=UPI0025EBB83F|nr:MazG-like family protein [uncultured Lactobacillus sp.]